MRSSGEEQRVRRAIGAVSAAEINCPELVNSNGHSIGILQGTYVFSLQIESVNRAGVRVVRDEYGVAQRPEV